MIVFCTFGLVFSGPPLVHAEDEATGENGSQEQAGTQQAENVANAEEILASEETAGQELKMKLKAQLTQKKLL